MGTPIRLLPRKWVVLPGQSYRERLAALRVKAAQRNFNWRVVGELPGSQR